ncbi:MAG: DNA-methyltransferase [bacterium]
MTRAHSASRATDGDRAEHDDGAPTSPTSPTATAATSPTADDSAGNRNRIVLADNLEYIRALDDGVARLIYIDPPFNTGKRQLRARISAVRDERGDRVGFQGRRYRTTELGVSGYDDSFDDFQAFLRPRLIEAKRLLAADGSFFLHIDWREAHYCKVALDQIFGRESFINEIIWAYDYGARSRRKWPAKHDTILWYANDPRDYVFHYDAMDRIPYLAPALVGADKAARGKTPTDVWWHTIVSPTGKEKTGYATQKPLGVLERIIKVHSDRGDLVLDFFAGSGTTGAAAAKHGRRFLLIDDNPQAVEVMRKRLAKHRPQHRP